MVKSKPDRPERQQPIDQAIADILAGDRRTQQQPERQRPVVGRAQEKESPDHREQERMKKRQPGRATYDLPTELKEKIAELSIEYGCPQSQIVTLLLIDGLGKIAAGDIDLIALQIKSDSPKFAYNLELTEALAKLRKLL